MVIYKNPLYNPNDKYYGPEYYQTDVKPSEYKGYSIYHVKKDQYDVVQYGICVAQMAGLNGAKRAIDKLIEEGAGRE